MDQIITFDKSLQTRLNEYEEVFSGLKALPYSKIKTEWAYYLELTLDPIGWQAVWKIPRLKCEELKIPFPTIVLVYVVNVSYADLTGIIKILAVQDDIHLPEKHYVPLTQLWPTKQQDRTFALNLNLSANVLDMLRFFYIHVLMPWDEDDDSVDWKGAHLISRLRLYYDLKNGKIPKATCEHIHSLLNEARRLNTKRQQLANTCDDFDSDIVEGDNDENMEALIEINVRLIEIQNEVHLLENEMFRKVILKRQQSSEANNSALEENVHVWIVSSSATASGHIKLLKSIEELYPNQLLSFTPNLMAKLDSANISDTILLSPNKHTIKSEGALIDNFLIKGIGDRDKVEVLSLADGVMFDCVGDSPIFENITFDCKATQCAILARKGHVTIKNCKLTGDHASTTHHGILVLKGAKLSLVSCEILGFSMAVIANTGSTVDIKDTLIHKVRSGVQIYDNCQMGIYGSTIKDCKEFGVIVETEQDFTSEVQQGNNSFDALDIVPHVIKDSISGSNNQKGDVAIKKSKIKAIEDLFENPDLHRTILGDSDDEEMDTSLENNLNNTVLEMHKS